MRTVLFTLTLVLSMLACHRATENLSSNEAFFVDIYNCKALIDLKLSDLIDSCWLVPLETTDESILGSYISYVFLSDDYILIDDLTGIYKFSKDGRFLKKILKIGRGPQELSQIRLLDFSDEKNILFIDDFFRDKDYINCYDIISENFLPSIKKCLPEHWGDFAVFQDTLIVGSLSGYDPVSSPYALFFQDFKGNFIYGVQSKRKYIPVQGKNEALQRMLIYTGDNLIHVKYVFDDTLFTYINNHLSPYLIVNNKATQFEPPQMLPSIGDKRTYFERFENPNFLIFSSKTYQGSIPLQPGVEKADYKTVYLFLDKSNGKYGIIKSFTDNFIGNTQSYENGIMTLPTSLPNGKLYMLYYPHELLQKTSTDFFIREFPPRIYNQLDKIKEEMNDTDNPILLIGMPKKGFKL